MIDLLKDTNCVIQSITLPDGTVKAVEDVATLDCIGPIVANVVFWLLVFAGIVALVLIIISGIKFITSGGDQKRVEGARKTLTYAIAGLVLILLSFAIVRFIAQTTGVGCITEFGFTNCQPKCGNANPSGYCRTGTCQRTHGDPGHYTYECR